MGTIDAFSVAQRKPNVRKAKLENSFYNIVNGETISTHERLSVRYAATDNQLPTVPDSETGENDLGTIIDPARTALFGGIAVIPIIRRSGRCGLASTLFEILSFQPMCMKAQVSVWSLTRKVSYSFPASWWSLH